MRRVAQRTGAAFVLGLGLLALPVAADDSNPSTPPAKAPDWSGYVYVADVGGEVVRADDKKVTLRITWYEPQAQKGSNTTNRNNNNRRPNLGGNNRNYRNPYSQNRPKSQPKVQMKEHHHDYDLEYVPESLVRLKTLPPKTDETGKRAAYTQKELTEARAPAGVIGYAASPFDVTPGTYLEVLLVRDRTIPAAKATEDDLRIKYAVIWGKDPNPPKDIATPQKDVKKKK